MRVTYHSVDQQRSEVTVGTGTIGLEDLLLRKPSVCKDHSHQGHGPVNLPREPHHQ